MEIRGSLPKVSPGKTMRPYPKNKLKARRTGGLAHMVECSPSKYKALSQDCQREEEKGGERKGKKRKKMLKRTFLQASYLVILNMVYKKSQDNYFIPFRIMSWTS
jgi:hypothetical protein